MSRKWLYLDYNTKNQKVRKKIKKFLYKKSAHYGLKELKGKLELKQFVNLYQ